MPRTVEYSTYSSTPDDNAQHSASFSSSNDDRTSTRTSVLNSSSGDVISHTMSSNTGGSSNNVVNRSVYSNQAFTGRATSTQKSTVNKTSQSTENTKKKTSNNTGLIVTFVILGIAAVGGVGYYFYNKRR